MKKISVIVAFCLFLSGCFNYKEIRDSAVVTAISIDVSDSAKYKVGAEVVKAGDMGDSLENEVLSVDCNSLTEGLSEIVKLVNKNVYLGYCELIIIGERLAERGISDILDYFIRNIEYRNDLLVFISKDSEAKAILNTKNIEQKIIGHGLSDSLKADEDYQATSVYSKLYKIMNETKTDNCSSMISVLKKESNNDEEIIKISGSAYFKGDKILGFLSENDTFFINLLNNRVKLGNFTVKYDDELLGVRLLDSACNINLVENRVKINLQLSVAVTEDNNRSENEENYNMIISNDVKTKITRLLYETIKYKKADLVGLYSKVNLSEEQFHKFLSESEKEIDVSVKIKGSGINEYYS